MKILSTSKNNPNDLEIRKDLSYCFQNALRMLATFVSNNRF